MFFVTHPLLMGTRLCPCRGCCELGGTGIFLDKDSEEGLLGHKVVLFLFEEPPHCFHGDCTAFPPQSHGAPARSTPLGSCGDCRSSHAGSWPFLAPVARAHLRPVHGCPFAWKVLSPPRCHLSREAAHLAHHTCAFTCPGAWLSLVCIGHGLRGGTAGQWWPRHQETLHSPGAGSEPTHKPFPAQSGDASGRGLQQPLWAPCPPTHHPGLNRLNTSNP